MDVIEFVEKVCGCQLLDYQKEFLRKMQSVSGKDNYQIVCLRSGRIVVIPEERMLSDGSRKDGYKSEIYFVDEFGIGKGAGDGL
jgi:hypothetical protein